MHDLKIYITTKHKRDTMLKTYTDSGTEITPHYMLT